MRSRRKVNHVKLKTKMKLKSDYSVHSVPNLVKRPPKMNKMMKNAFKQQKNLRIMSLLRIIGAMFATWKKRMLFYYRVSTTVHALLALKI